MCDEVSIDRQHCWAGHAWCQGLLDLVGLGYHQDTASQPKDPIQAAATTGEGHQSPAAAVSSSLCAKK